MNPCSKPPRRSTALSLLPSPFRSRNLCINVHAFGRRSYGPGVPRSEAAGREATSYHLYEPYRCILTGKLAQSEVSELAPISIHSVPNPRCRLSSGISKEDACSPYLAWQRSWPPCFILRDRTSLAVGLNGPANETRLRSDFPVNHPLWK